MKQVQRIRKVAGEVQNREKLLKWFNHYLDKMVDGDYTMELRECTRTDAQNKYYWVVLGIMAQAFGTTAEDLHDHFKEEYLPSHEYFTLISQKKLRSTTEQTKDQFVEYLDKVIRFAAENGVVIPDIEEYKHMQ